ncbi:MAG: ABC transporter substrate-binding protein [Thermoproteota archaeon]
MPGAPEIPRLPGPAPPDEEYRIITITDNAGRNVTVKVPVKRIVSLNSGLTEMLCALGVQNKIVGRDATSTMPPSILSVPVVGEHSYQPNVEAIIELKPDIVFADSMLPYNTVAMRQLEEAGIPIFISDPTDPTPTPRSNTTVVDFTCSLLMKMAIIVGGESKAREYIQFAQYYNNLVKQRIASLSDEQRPKVMWEWYAPYWTFISPAIYHAGGINIAENMTVYAPIMSPEFVVEQNPQVIIRMISSPTHDLNDFVQMWQEIMSRPELQVVDAVKNGRVYICDWKLRNGILTVVGYLYFAKWVQPTLFEDIDPAQVMAEIYQRFFGITVEGTFVYP